jgi:hypothetical protein
MSILNRTSLTSSDKLNLLSKTVGCQPYGSISSLADEFGISRKTLYQTQNAAKQALQSLVSETDESDIITTVGVDADQLRRTIVALSCTAPVSIRAIEEQLPLIYPGCKASYGYIQGVIIEAQQNAALFNQRVCLSNIRNIAVDEMFSQGKPVLAGIDLDSGFLCSLSLEASRDGATWATVLEQAKSQGMSPDCVVKDGATGIAKGVAMVFPDTQQRDDAFHALYITGKAVRKAERKAYRYIEKEASALKKLRQTAPADEHEYQQAIEKAAGYEHKCQAVIEEYESAAKGLSYLHTALKSVCFISGEIISEQMAVERLMLAVRCLRQSRETDCHDAARYLENRLQGLTLATRTLHDRLQGIIGQYTQTQVELACRLVERQRGFGKLRNWQKNEVIQEMAYCYRQLQQCSDDSDELLSIIAQFLSTRHRASSAIEGFNATLRSYLYVRKGVSQGFLALFQAWHNLRERRWGKHKGTSVYQSLTGKPVDDWLTLLGFPPSRQNN